MAIFEEESVRLVREGVISELRLQRPKALNALSPDVLQSLMLLLARLDKQDDMRVVILSAEGEKAFAAGADISSMSQLGPRAIADYAELGQRVMRALEQCRVPVIAAVQGYALGGGLELALACDLIVASENAKVGLPEVGLGLIPGFGGTQRLSQRCGIGAARRLIYTGELITAGEAEKIGLVDYVCAASALTAQVEKMAQVIASRGPLAVQRAKAVIRHSSEPQVLSGLRMEVEGFLDVFATRDREEGMEAFMQKREARFTGK